jgi:isopenicillin-N epimerase
VSPGSEHARHWDLDPEVAFLNHGSYGACPRVVLAAQTEWRARLEREPVHFFTVTLEPALDAARDALGRFVGADPDDLAFVPNATTGVNTVLASLDSGSLGPGDELLTTDHEYNASRNALDAVAARSGARVVVATLPWPLRSPEDAVAALLEHVTDRTRIALIDHVTSPTGLVTPIAELVAALRERGIDTLVDGAHAPGMLPLDLEALGVAYYTGNGHKWICSPKGSALLYVRRDRQATIRPLAISHGANSPRTDRSRFRLEFDWGGTVDPSPWLAMPDALRFMGGLFPGGWTELRAHNHDLVVRGRDCLNAALDAEPLAPADALGSLATVVLPPIVHAPDPSTYAPWQDPLQARLVEQYRIQVPVMYWPAHDRRYLRISGQAYNDVGQYEALAAALISESA